MRIFQEIYRVGVSMSWKYENFPSGRYVVKISIKLITRCDSNNLPRTSSVLDVIMGETKVCQRYEKKPSAWNRKRPNIKLTN